MTATSRKAPGNDRVRGAMSVPDHRAAPAFPSVNGDGIARDEAGIASDGRAIGRLPAGLAFPLIVLLSLASWALVLTVVLWLDRIAG